MKDAYKTYFLIGPYFPDKAKLDFIEEPLPKPFDQITNTLQQEGILLHYGTWQIKGKPKTLLIDFQGYSSRKNDLKKEYWDHYHIDSLTSRWDFEEPLIWSSAAGRVLELYTQQTKEKTIAHCHEWLAGFTLLYLTMRNIQIGTVFTTHATTVGRVLSAEGIDIYTQLAFLRADDEAKKRNVQDKHLTEKACAHTANVFTTVSEITSMEAEHFLGKKPDILVLNGLDINKFPSFEETSYKHQINREIIREFISYYFFPHYYFDPEQTLTMFIVGRYEYKNKGIDIFIQSLARLNTLLQQEHSKRTVVAFFWIPRDVQHAQETLAKNKAAYHQLDDFIRSNFTQLKARLINNTMQCDNASYFINEEAFHKEHLFTEDYLQQLKKIRLNFTAEGLPPQVTHHLASEQDDIILQNFRSHGLDNSPETKVKVIFYPVYLSGVDGLIDLPYYEAIMGCHLGLFPSYYEPWGYTPLESAALGVPSLTTDLGGFGRFLQSQKKGNNGVFVLERYKKNEEDTVNAFTTILHDFTKLDHKGRVAQKLMAKQTSNLADWKSFITYYIQASILALERAYQ